MDLQQLIFEQLISDDTEAHTYNFVQDTSKRSSDSSALVVPITEAVPSEICLARSCQAIAEGLQAPKALTMKRGQIANVKHSHNTWIIRIDSGPAAARVKGVCAPCAIIVREKVKIQWYVVMKNNRDALHDAINSPGCGPWNTILWKMKLFRSR